MERAPGLTSEPAMAARTPGSLRQRQRDTVSSRGGRLVEQNDVLLPTRRNGRLERTDVKLSCAPQASSSTKPLLDLCGNRPAQGVSRHGTGARTRGDSDFTPDEVSAGREGRQFTVANVGNNGRIYLRPTVRPVNQQYPQPSFVFPMTAPNTSELDALISQEDRVQYSRASPPRRALSQSTVDEHTLPLCDSDIGAFKVVIERPGTESKPAYRPVVPSLSVPIPTYKLGTPRFSIRGTPYFRASSCTTTDELHSSVISKEDDMHRNVSTACSGPMLSRQHSESPLVRLHAPSPVRHRSSLVNHQRDAIVPEMYDVLTFKPSSDDPSVVRYSVKGGMRAGTPARLVAEITSDTFVDYDLLSDFFLTYRSFLEPLVLLYMLVARFKWAVSRGDKTGCVVRVRAFVALRHWILNYFSDDFVVDWELRRCFCDLINGLSGDLSMDQPNAKVPLRILDELKRCWRRVCSLYWDGPEFSADLEMGMSIVPGGVAGCRNPNLDPSFWERYSRGPPQLGDKLSPDSTEPKTSFQEIHNHFSDVPKTDRIGSGSPQVHDADSHADYDACEPPLSPISMTSDVVSCSVPPRVKVLGMPPALGPHPAPAKSTYDCVSRVASTPKALQGKHIRPQHPHKRSGSFPDLVRGNYAQQPLQKVVFKSTELLLALPYAGSLVRGNLFPPGQALVELLAPSTPAETSRANTLCPATNQKAPSAMSGPGMKKLLGSVRRVLGTRPGVNGNASPTEGSFPHIPPLGDRGATVNRLPGTAVVPQERPRHTAQTRIDLLGAQIAEDFKRAVQEDADAGNERRQSADKHSGRSPEDGVGLQYLNVGRATAAESRPSLLKARASEMTSGSKSVLIVDDTLPPHSPWVAGASSIEAYQSSVATNAHRHPVANPTPPTTPSEAQSRGFLSLHQVVTRDIPSTSESFITTPSFILDSRPSQDDAIYPDRPYTRLSIRQPTRRSHRSKGSGSLLRHASFHGEIPSQRSERSLDATTSSELDDKDRLSEVSDLSDLGSASQPLRMLRRRPGGDLRAATNVADLNSRPLRRPMSTGSLTVHSDSVASSYFLARGPSSFAEDRGSYAHPQNASKFSLGALAGTPCQSRESRLSRRSPHSITRPSFEKLAQMIAQIPDDNDDGGVESALLKLEGKFEQRQANISGEAVPHDLPLTTDIFGANPLDVSTLTLEDEEEDQRSHRHRHIVETKASRTSTSVESYRPRSQPDSGGLRLAVYQPMGMPDSRSTLSHTRSVDLYHSTPLLDRVSIEIRNSRIEASDWSHPSLPCRLTNNRQSSLILERRELSPASSFNFITRESVGPTNSHKQNASRGSAIQSFLESDSDEKQSMSGLSSEISMETQSNMDFANRSSLDPWQFMPSRPGNAVVNSPEHPLRHPPSPPITLVQALSMSPRGAEPPLLYESQLAQNPLQKMPDSPEVTPPGTFAERVDGGRQAIPAFDPLSSHSVVEPSRKTSSHLPFILAFDSQVLAQQFTLIEKDALNEIDWKDLTEMRWKNSNTDSRSWVDFLRSSESRGVEVVIARFNIMVKWAVSECVLTEDIEERAQCISKYVHIAANCRKHRNFATMTQITMALTCKDITRLRKTWARVPTSDIQTVKELEALVTPMSNFFNLRAEMEGSGADQGCIPFVGIYTHDLLMNSERPTRIASTPTSEPLVNFEKCRSNAAIVKNLLRLVEASQLYRFLPIEGITERCLWMAALSDEKIARYGNLIE